jgi:hypothetical protein
MIYLRAYLLPDNERSRLTEAQRRQILGNTPENLFNYLVRPIFNLVYAQIVLLSIISDERQRLKSRQGSKADLAQ